MKTKIILYVFAALYIFYFSVFSIMRYRNMHANYFDLGIMHHVVYNSYKALQTGDWMRFLEHTDPIGPSQLARSAVHNDIILGLFSPLYFLYPSPEVLLLLQAFVLGLGALAVFGIANHVLKKDLYSFIFAISYLLYVPLQYTNRFDFHSVTLSTSFLLFMFYFWLEKKYRWCTVFLVLSLITKEQVGLTTMFFGLYALLSFSRRRESRTGSPIKLGMTIISNLKKTKEGKFTLLVIITSLIWVGLSFFVIIPYFRGAEHFATERYQNINVIQTLFRQSTFDYLWNLFAPLGFLSLLSPAILIALPELAINLLSQDSNMRSVVFHYTAVITPFIFISGIYGFKRITNYPFGKLRAGALRIGKRYRIPNTEYYLLGAVLTATLWFSFTKSPLPYSMQKDVYVYNYQKNADDARYWATKLKDDSISVSATGNVGTFLSSRRKFYYFSKYYDLADYVIIRPNEIYHYQDKDKLIPIYEQLVRDPRYMLIDERENFEVYKKFTITN